MRDVNQTLAKDIWGNRTNSEQYEIIKTNEKS